MGKTVEEIAYARAAAICLRFPGAEVKLSHGAPSFHVKNKHFATFSRGGYGEPLPALWIKCTHDDQRDLVAREPGRYFVPPYVGVAGWVGARLDPALGDAGANDADLAVLIENGWAAIAPKKLLNEAPKSTGPKPALALPMTDPKLSAAALARVRQGCDLLVDVETEIAARHATFRAFGKPFCYFYDNQHGDERISVCVRVDVSEIATLVAAKPKLYFVPSYIGHRGWLGIRLDATRVTDKELRTRIAESYAAIAPKRTGTRSRR